MFSEKDLQELAAHNVSLSKVEEQINNFKKGFPFLQIIRPASIGDGIIAYSESECADLVAGYDKLVEGKKIVKFVPASGAATRMFKAVFEFVNDDKPNKGVENIVANIEKMPFYAQLSEFISSESTPKEIANAIIADTGLNYGNLPKGVLMFHKYGEQSATPVEEHLVEGAKYAVSANSEVNIHFTVSVEFEEMFKALVEAKKGELEAEYGVKYNVTYSNQLPSTDTLAVDMNNEPFRNNDGSLLLRPAGHGALIENLNSICADVIFIKNIDNVLHRDYIEDTITYKKVLGALLIEVQNEVFSLLNKLEAGEDVVADCIAFIETKLGVKLGADFAGLSAEAQKECVTTFLNRPIRIAGMVKNQGEPGGGPFWVKESGVGESLQIAESSQISPEQIDLMKTATHFNPVDIVCATKNYKGEKFELNSFVDYESGFISQKSKDGKDLKAIELPGLWNGSMSNWISLFVEVPVTTFNPVKEVADLLKSKHNAK
ncbi:MAG: DUF4301 family protein [Rikenellaceae bacterium]